MSSLAAALREGRLEAVEYMREALENDPDGPWSPSTFVVESGEALRRGAAAGWGELRHGPGHADKVRRFMARFHSMFTKEEWALIERRVSAKYDWNEIAALLSTPARRVDPADCARRFAEMCREIRELERECGLRK